MPWKSFDVLQQREQFVNLAIQENQSFNALCSSFGISRKTGYKWLRRYQQTYRQISGLSDRSRRPHHSPLRTGLDIENRLLVLRDLWGWGARKLSEEMRRDGFVVSRSTVHRILQGYGRVAKEDLSARSWIERLWLAHDPRKILGADLPSSEIVPRLVRTLRNGRPGERKKAMALLAKLKGFPTNAIANSLQICPRTVVRYFTVYDEKGLDGLFAKRKSKVNDDEYKAHVFSLLHSPPSEHKINRTSWRMVDLHRVLSSKGHTISENRIRRIIRAAGYRWRKARTVLTSKDPDYHTKLDAIMRTLTQLRPDEAFFSVDEYGPFAIKRKGGRKRVAPGETYEVLQFQKSKGWTILTAALELASNQVTHFYSRQKNTDEMIRMADLLRDQYRHCSTIYLSWDAASWHVSKKLVAHLEGLNGKASRDGYPLVKTAPLPAGSQFLNVIESVFSGMARAIIHNSDYSSVEAGKDAIDRYFLERNVHFSQHPKRAGCKIWGKERVPSEFQEGQNCKDPLYS